MLVKIKKKWSKKKCTAAVISPKISACHGDAIIVSNGNTSYVTEEPIG